MQTLSAQAHIVAHKDQIGSAAVDEVHEVVAQAIAQIHRNFMRPF